MTTKSKMTTKTGHDRRVCLALFAFVAISHVQISKGILNPKVHSKSTRCGSVTQEYITEVCAKSLHTCHGHCDEAPGQGQRSCNCDRFCVLYDDCCLDFELTCLLLVKYKEKAEEKGLKSTCLDNGERAIHGCKDYQDSFESSPELNDLCTGRGTVQYTSESVMKNCTIFPSTSCVPWEYFLPSKEETDLGGIREKLRGYQNHWKRHYNLFYYPRSCVKYGKGLDTMQSLQLGSCKNYLSHLYHQQCSDRGSGVEGQNYFDVYLTDMSTFNENNTLGGTPTVAEIEEMNYENFILYTFVKNNQGDKVVFTVISEKSNRNKHFWKEIICFTDEQNSTRLETDKFVNSDVQCYISKCAQGHFFVSNKCLKPDMLTISVIAFDVAFQQPNSVFHPVRKGLIKQNTFALNPLGERMELFDQDLYIYTDHYEVAETFQNDTNKTLSVSQEIHSEMMKAFNEENDNGFNGILVCICFQTGALDHLERCDNITFNGIESTVTNYMLRQDDKTSPISTYDGATTNHPINMLREKHASDSPNLTTRNVPCYWKILLTACFLCLI